MAPHDRRHVPPGPHPHLGRNAAVMLNRIRGKSDVATRRELKAETSLGRALGRDSTSPALPLHPIHSHTRSDECAGRNEDQRVATEAEQAAQSAVEANGETLKVLVGPADHTPGVYSPELRPSVPATSNSVSERFRRSLASCDVQRICSIIRATSFRSSLEDRRLQDQLGSPTWGRCGVVAERITVALGARATRARPTGHRRSRQVDLPGAAAKRAHRARLYPNVKS